MYSEKVDVANGHVDKGHLKGRLGIANGHVANVMNGCVAIEIDDILS